MAPEGGAGAYFHLEPGEVYAGGGLYRPDSRMLAAWRRLVDAEPETVRGAIIDPAFVAAYGELTGERRARVPAGYPRDHPEADLLRLKDQIFTARLSDDDVTSPALPDILADLYAAAGPVWPLLARVAREG